jgi:flagellar protein FlaG
MNAIDKVISLSSEQGIAAQNNNKEVLPSPPKDSRSQHEFQGMIHDLHDAISENLGIDNFKLNFSVDSETKTVVVQVLDSDTGKVIREIPAKEILAMAKEIDKLKGILFNENV